MSSAGVAADASSLSTPSRPRLRPRYPLRPAPIPDRSRLIESSSYIRALLGGSLSESGRSAVRVPRYLFEPSGSFAITHENFLQLLEGALFLAVQNLRVDYERWFRTMRSQGSSKLAPLDFIVEVTVWYFAQKHGVTFVEAMYPEYLAQNLVQVISSRSFAQIPYDLLCSTIECPHLTVDSEKQLYEFYIGFPQVFDHVNN